MMGFAIRLLFVFIVSALGVSVVGCGNGADSPNRAVEVVIQVNDRKISLTEFNTQFKYEAQVDPEMDLSEESREQFIDYLIQKELMIQEAVRLKLDHKKEFVTTIQKYWEATLIRDLISRESEKFRKKVLVTREEVQTYYKEHKDEFGLPLERVEEDIRALMESEKLEVSLEAWTETLKNQATIHIDRSQMK